MTDNDDALRAELAADRAERAAHRAEAAVHDTETPLDHDAARLSQFALSGLWSEHAALATTLLLGVLTVTALLQAAEWHLPTALAILNAAGPGNLVIGTVAGFAPTLLSTLTWVYVSYIAYARAAGLRDFHSHWYAIAILLFLVCVLNLSYATLVVILAMTIWAAFLGRRLSRRLDQLAWQQREDTAPVEEEAARAFLVGVLGSIVVTVVVPFVLGPPIWLPRENLAFKGQPDQRLTAYVLKSDDKSTVILTMAPRQVLYKSDSLIAREICSPQLGRSATVMSFGLRRTLNARDDPVCITQ